MYAVKLDYNVRSKSRIAQKKQKHKNWPKKQKNWLYNFVNTDPYDREILFPHF